MQQQAPASMDLSAGMVPKAAPQSGYSAFLDSSGASQLGNALMHPIHTAATVADAAKRVFTPGQPARMSDNPNPIISGIGNAVDASRTAFKQGMDDYKTSGLSLQTRRDFGRSVPIIGPALSAAQQYHDDGNDGAAAGTLLGTVAGLAAPKMLESLPGVFSKTASVAGKAMEDSGANRMDRFLNGGNALDALKAKGKLAADAKPGLRVLQEGPTVSVAPSRATQAQNIRAALPVRDAEVSAAVANSPATVPWADVRQAVDDNIHAKRSVASGPGGNPNVGPRLTQLRSTFEPAIDAQGNASMSDLYDARKTMDKNINWNRGPDPVDATVRNATRDVRAGVSRLMYQADPSLAAPNARYADLASAAKLADKNVGKAAPSLFSPARLLAAGTIAGTGALAHFPGVGATPGLLTEIGPAVWGNSRVQTGLATGMYQAGRGLQAVGGIDVPMVRVPVSAGLPLAGQFSGIAPSKKPQDQPNDIQESSKDKADVNKEQNQLRPPSHPH